MRRLAWLLDDHRRSWIGYVAALASVALVSGLIALVEARTHVANLSMLYLIAVLATASVFGSGPAVFAAIAAFLTFDWFFVEPRHTFAVADPAEWVALLLFLLTAVVTGQLAAGQRLRAKEAQRREREVIVLYDVVRLMSEPDLDHSLQVVAERLRQELRLAAVVIDVSLGDRMSARATVGEPEALRLVHPPATSPRHVLGETPHPVPAEHGASGRWIRVVPPRPPALARPPVSDRLHIVPVKVEDRRRGALLLVRAPGAPPFTAADDRLLLAAAAQLGAAVERIRFRREATEAEILRRTDQSKNAVLHAVSHDLRTPLASIIASAGSLRQQGMVWTDEERQDVGEVIEQEAQRLNRIVGNLLDLSRIEAGGLRPEKGWYDLGALVDDVLGRLKPITAQHRLIVTVPEDLPPVPLDYVEIDQVLTNLLENACRYTSPGTEIRIAARLRADEVAVEVADSGPGIAPHALPHLFEPFYRAAGQGTRPTGAGLGLAVAARLVEAHGGRMWAESPDTGGARFIFTLPLAASKEPVA